MPKLLFISFFFFLVANYCACQSLNTKVIKKEYSKDLYTDFTIKNDTIYALTVNNKIKVFNTSGDELNKSWKSSDIITILTTDKHGDLIISDANYNVKRFNSLLNKWDIVFHAADKITGILFTSRNQLFVITAKGIVNAKTNKTYECKEFYNPQLRLPYAWEKPSTYCMDKDDNIWVGFGFGEWGGELQKFSTITSQFMPLTADSLNVSLSPVQSVFEGNGSVYVTTGLQHMGMLASAISQFKQDKALTIFNDESYSNSYNKDSVKKIAEYIGPGAFNRFDSSIYFYSQHGIFKGSINKNLSTINNWVKVLEPKLRWSWGMPDAVGAPMNVFKMAFANNGKLVFVTENDGLGFFDGQALTMVR